MWKGVKSHAKIINLKYQWNEDFELPGESISDIQDYFKYIIRKHETVSDNPPVIICVNKIERKIIFKIKTGYCLQLVTSETMKLLRSTNSKLTKNEMVKMCLV